MFNEKVAVVILNYNGVKFLKQFLETVTRHSAGCTIYLADNGSTDESVAYTQQHHPHVKVLENGGNFGYARGYVMALAKIQAEYFVLLNSDVEVCAGWTEPIIALMDKNPDVGACQPKILDYNTRQAFEYAGAAGGYIDRLGYPFCRGRLFNAIEEDKGQYDTVSEIFWATGACLFVRAEAYYKAGGLDGRYFAHMEEIDLCWRLRNFGYKIMAVPQSSVYHIGGGTLNKLSRRKTYLNFRNNLTTLTKNHPFKNLLPKIFIRLILDGVAAFKFLFDGQPKHFFAVLHAHFSYYAWLPYIVAERRRLKRSAGFKYNFGCIYKGNIVFEHFIGGKKTFSNLLSGFFRQ